MTLKSELIEAMAQGVHAGRIAPHEAQWHELTDRERDCCRFDAQAALSAHSAFLTERGLKVVPLVATDEMEDATRDASCVGDHGAEERGYFSDEYHCALAVIPDLFAEADVAYARGLRDAQQWLPVADAPRDGTPLLLFWPQWSDTPMIGAYSVYVQGWRADNAIAEDGPGPTNYMPLPPPPEPKS